MTRLQVVASPHCSPEGLPEGVQVPPSTLFPAARGAQPGRSPGAPVDQLEAHQVLAQHRQQVAGQVGLLVARVDLEFDHLLQLDVAFRA